MSQMLRRHLTFQSTPSVGRATLSECTECEVTEISIHALRGEGDPKNRRLK